MSVIVKRDTNGFKPFTISRIVTLSNKSSKINIIWLNDIDTFDAGWINIKVSKNNQINK